MVKEGSISNMVCPRCSKQSCLFGLLLMQSHCRSCKVLSSVAPVQMSHFRQNWCSKVSSRRHFREGDYDDINAACSIRLTIRRRLNAAAPQHFKIVVIMHATVARLVKWWQSLRHSDVTSLTSRRVLLNTRD